MGFFIFLGGDVYNFGLWGCIPEVDFDANNMRIGGGVRRFYNGSNNRGLFKQGARLRG